MNINTRKTAIALAVAMLAASPAGFAQTVDDQNASADIVHNHEVNETRNNTNNTNNTSNTTVNSDTREESNSHKVAVSMDKSLKLSSDIAITGAPTVSGDIHIDSAAIAIIDNRQSVSNNTGLNDMLDNQATIGDDVGKDASGNLGFNVAAGDNNVQDNAASLSAADASFAFGMTDAEVFVNQAGMGNYTLNRGVTNNASVGANAFSNASGNIGVNVASGNNNEQKNALAASVATSAYAQSSINSNQVSSGNYADNAGHYEERTQTTEISMSGPVSGWTAGYGYGGYSGSSQGSYEGTGSAYQMSNFYPDNWDGNSHPSGSQLGHSDFDADAQGAVANPYRDGVGGLAFDTDQSGSYSGTESGELGFYEFGYADLYASLSGSVTNSYFIAVDATNTASLSGSAFSGATGNIGVNIAAGTGNLQANSLAMAIAQPSTGGGTPPPGGE